MRFPATSVTLLAALLVAGCVAEPAERTDLADRSEGVKEKCPKGVYETQFTQSYEPDDCFDGCNYGMMVDGKYGSNAVFCPSSPECPASPPVERSPAAGSYHCKWTLPCGTIQAFTYPRPVTGKPGPFRWYFSSLTCPVDTSM